MLRPSALVSVVVVALLAFPAAASEAGDSDAFPTHLLGKDPATAKVRACFTRVYDAQHLAQHPQQKVGAMLVLVEGDRDAESKTIFYKFTLGLKYRGKTQQYTSQGGCSHATDEAGKLSCGVDCDGGPLEIVLSADDKSVLVSADPARGGFKIWKKELDSEWFDAGADDRSFRLDRAKLVDCLPLANDKQEAAEMKQGH